MHKYQNWVVADPEVDKVNNLAKQLMIDPLIATLLVNRNISQPLPARQFLTEEWQGEIPRLEGCDQAVGFLREAKDNNLTVVIYGDYDVDGICSTAIIYECLQQLGYKVSYRLPNRFVEGYGLTTEAVEEIAASGAGMLVTVDCGISALDEVKLARDLGLKTIITDHHQPGPELPNADIIINPQVNPSEEGRELCGAGVAFVLASCLLKQEGQLDIARRWLDLLALATVADIVPLTGYNRLWVREGLGCMRNRVGIQQLLAAARVREGELSTYHIGFMLAPRLNAAGRLENAGPALELLLTQDRVRAEELASWLDTLNSQRQQLEEQIYQQAVQRLLNRENDLPEVLVLDGDDWHQGVIGIVASRVSQRFQRPALIVSWGEENGKGSARSIAGFDIMEALRQSAAYLDQFGGHRGAAGVEISRDKYELFCNRVNQVASECYYEPDAVSTLKIDSLLPTSRLNLELGYLGDRLRPYGEGNPAPIFQTTVYFERVTVMGKNSEHFKGWLAGVQQTEVISFREGQLANEIIPGNSYDLAYTPEINNFNGRTSLSLKLIDIRPSTSDIRIASPDSTNTADKPCLIVCPDQRSLDLLWPYYREIFGEKAAVLCGRSLNGRQNQELFGRGENTIFLTTLVYFPYHIKKFGLFKSWDVRLPVSSKFYPDAFFELLMDVTWEEQLIIPELAALEDNRERKAIYLHRSKPEYKKTETIDEIEFRQRSDKLAARQAWWQQGGTLLTAGEVLNVKRGKADILYLEDPPLSQGEWELLKIGFDPAEIEIGFTSEDLLSLNSYYKTRYPEAQLIGDVLKYLAAHCGRQKVLNRERLVYELSQSLGSPISWQLLANILVILTQTGVIEVRTQNENVAIKITTASGEVRLADSLLYLEGRWEIKAGQKWAAELQKMAGMGGDN